MTVAKPALTSTVTLIMLFLSNHLSTKVKDKLFPDADFSPTTMFMALRGANWITEQYPKEFEQGCCQKAWKKDEYDMLKLNLIYGSKSH
jgi:hypothetical protein